MNSNTSISLNGNFREKVLAGVTKLSEVVGSTMGPMGSNVVIRQNGQVHCTKDGVTACRAVSSSDPMESIGIELVREASEQTNHAVGDGTSGTCVLAGEIFSNGLKHLAFGANGIHLRNGISKAADLAVKYIRSISKPVSTDAEVWQIAKISSNQSDEIANVLSDVFSKIGKNGTIRVEQGNTMDIESRIVEGLQFDNGYLSPFFVTNEKLEANLENPYIIIANRKIEHVTDMMRPLQAIAKTKRPLLVIADEVEGDALPTLVMNKLRGMLQVCVVKSPSYGPNRKEMLQDIAILTGGKVIGEDTGISLENATPDTGILGTARRVVVTKENTTIIGGLGDPDAIKERIEQLKVALGSTKDEYMLRKISERLAKLDGGVGIISVGAKTEAEMQERRDLVDDAFCACRAAIAGGIVPGGGSALFHARRYLEEVIASDGAASTFADEDELTGARVLAASLDCPLRRILTNAGVSPDLVMEEIPRFEGLGGYDVVGGKVCDLVSAGVVDPTDVVVAEVNNASSIASLMLTTGAAIVEEPPPQQPASGQVEMPML